MAHFGHGAFFQLSAGRTVPRHARDRKQNRARTLTPTRWPPTSSLSPKNAPAGLRNASPKCSKGAIARSGEDAWKAQCETLSRQLALPAPQDAQPAETAEQTSRLRR